MPYKKKRKWQGRAAAARKAEKIAENAREADPEQEDNWNDASIEIPTATASIVEAATRNHCIYCHQDESDDPSGENEDEYLACSVCGDNAHQQCAKNQDSLEPGIDLEDWRCPGCIEHALEPSPAEKLRRLSASSSRMARNLLAAGQGTSRPLKHSIFNTLILDDDPLDGSRALRKRKASSEAAEIRMEAMKRQKRSSDSYSEIIAEVDQEEPAVERESDQEEVLPEAEAMLEVSEEEQQEPSEVEIEDQDNKEEHIDMTARSSPRGRGGYRGRGTRGRARGRGRGGARGRGRGASVQSFHDEHQLEPELDVENPTIIKSTPKSLVLLFRLDPTKMRAKEKKKTTRNLTFGTMPNLSRGTGHGSHAAPFYSMHDKEAEELKSKPYGGILSEDDADTTRTLPTAVDRAMFEEARQKAEEEWKRKTDVDEGDQEQRNRKISGPPSKIKCINFGGYEIETWYAAPYPEEYSRNRVLYICEFCLKYMSSDYVAWRHKLKCPAKHPPGDEIYRDKSISVFEVDGRKNPVYCQNLCLLAKLFLGSKTLYYDVEPFLFYIMTEYNELGCHFVGYFSKEKRPSSMNNVSCILTLPIHQRKGYGNLLIDFSYLLTRVERKTGSPEKPLSDMGLVSYRNYWRLILSYILVDQKEPLSVTDISEKTGMTADDIVAALEALRALVRDPVTKTYALRLDSEYYKQCIESWESKNYVRLNADALIWTPYVMGRGNLATYDRAPAISTVAPRDEDDDTSIVPEEGVQQETRIQAAIQQARINGTSDHDMDTPMVQINGTLINQEEQQESILVTTEEPLVNGHNDLATPTTPQTFSVETPRPKSPSPIPPTRYEVYPPVVGPTRQRGRGGWRGRGRGAATTSARRTGKPFSAVSGKMALANDTFLGKKRANAMESPSRRGHGKPLLNGSTTDQAIANNDGAGDESDSDKVGSGGEDDDNVDAEVDLAGDDQRQDSTSISIDSYDGAGEIEEEEEEEEEDDYSVADISGADDLAVEEDADDDNQDDTVISSRGGGRGRGRGQGRWATRSRGRGSSRGGARGRARGKARGGGRGVNSRAPVESDEEESVSNGSVSEEDIEMAEEEQASEDSDQDAEGEIDVDDV